MRTISYIVNGQSVTKDPDCDFTGLIPGTDEYLKMSLTFSPEWDDFIKVVRFTSGSHEYTPKIVDEINSCVIPIEAVKRPIFYIQILGKKENTKLITNKIAVVQNGGLL